MTFSLGVTSSVPTRWQKLLLLLWRHARPRCVKGRQCIVFNNGKNDLSVFICFADRVRVPFDVKHCLQPLYSAVLVTRLCVAADNLRTLKAADQADQLPVSKRSELLQSLKFAASAGCYLLTEPEVDPGLRPPRHSA